MPTHIRAMCCWQHGSALPRDVACINPCFRHQLGLDFGSVDWQPLADDLAAALNGWSVRKNQLTVKLYDLGDTAPISRPRATAVVQSGFVNPGVQPPELAICLSFNGGANGPHQRGRLYLPLWTVTGATPGVRPDTTYRDKVGDLAPIFAGLGGVNVDWIVWSRTNSAATKVERWYVDDEYDVQRRRGLQPSARTTGTTGA